MESNLSSTSDPNKVDPTSADWDPTIPELPGKIISGIRVPHFYDLESVEKLKNMKMRPDDIWVVSYPKCGTHWTMQIVRLILNRGKDDGKNIMETVLWIEAFNKDSPYNSQINLDELPSPRAFKSHFSYEMMPCGLPSTTPGRYIYLSRNPKDVVVSYYHHDRGFQFNPILEWSQYFEVFMQGKVHFGDYFDNILGWWAHKDDDNVLFLKYEDMKKDLPTTVARIAKFIGQDISQELVDEIAHRATFANMKKDSYANCKWVDDERRPDEADFIRKGAVGDWKNYFTPEQEARLDAVYEKRMKGTGLDFDFH